MDNLGLRSNYILTFQKINNVAYYTQSLSIPAITMGEAFVSNKVMDYNIPGSKLTFDKLIIEFLVDENLNNYTQLFNWMMEMRGPDNCKQQDVYSDATITILTNNKNPLKKFNFIDVFPITLDVLSFDYTGSATDPQTCNVTFSYSHFKILD